MLKRLLKTMARPIALGAFGLALVTNSVYAQLSSVYTTSTSSGSYTSITGGLSFGSSSSDDQMFIDSAASALGGSLYTTVASGPGIPIGFNFNFKGVLYDRLGICTNGWIALGRSSLSPAVNMSMQYAANYFNSPISTGFSSQATDLKNRIVALGIDLASQSGGSLRVETVGSAPYRSCIVQWENYKNYNGSGESYNFQIKLNETSNTVEIIYGAFTVGYTDYPQVGLLSGSDYMNRTNCCYGSWTTNTATGTNVYDDNELSGSNYPDVDLTYTWAPPLATYNSSTVVTASTVGVAPASTNQVIVGLEVNTTGFRGSLNLTNLDVSTNGTTVLSDIDSVKVYYTGTSSVFSTATQYGSTVTTPAVSNLVSGNVTLPEGVSHFWVAYDISSTATLGDFVDAQIASVTIGATTYVPTVTAPTGNREVAAPMTYVTSQAGSANDATKVAVSSTNNVVLGVQVVTSSSGSTIDLTSLDIATTGTTDTLDIQNLKVWYTGNSNVFATTVQFGSAVAVPGATQTITGSQSLNNDTNYFWVTYDIASTAIIGDAVDAEFVSATVDGTPQTPTATTATGNRLIRNAYCTPVVVYPGQSCPNNFYIANVVTTGGSTNISNATSCSVEYNNYANVPSQTLTVKKNTSFHITVSSLTTYQSAAIFIDFNGDGDFADAGERVAASTTYSTTTTMLSADILVPCDAQVGKTVIRIRGSYYNYIASDGCTTSSSGGSVYYGESEDYTIDIQDNPTVYVSSTAVQQTGNVATGGTDRAILRVPVIASGCQVGTVTEFRFNTNGTTNAADITNAKLYSTGLGRNFTTNKLLATVPSPSGQFIFTVTDTLMGNVGDTNNYWLAYDISGSATTTNVVDGEIDSLYATGAYHIPSVTAPAGNIVIEVPMTYISTTVVPSAANSVAQSTNNAEVVCVLVVTSSTGAPIPVTSMDIATAGTTSLSDVSNIKVWYTGNSKVFSAGTQFGSTISSPGATHTITGNQGLTNDSNYFWITYDVQAAATVGDSLDGACTSITVNAVAQTPTATNTTGFRRVRIPYCISTVYYPGTACSNNLYVYNVTTTGAINNLSNAVGCPLSLSNDYSDFTNKVVTVAKNAPFHVNVNAYYWATIWIDYNQDGDFDDVGEKVAGNSNYNYSTPTLSADITIPCSALTGKTVMRVRGTAYYQPLDACTRNAPSSGYVYYGEAEDYTIDIQDNPTVYSSSSTIQRTGLVSPSATNRTVLRVPVIASGCLVGTATEFRFSTTGSTNAGDITAAKLYATGNTPSFNANKLLATVASPSGQFTFTVNDTLLGSVGDTNNYWLTYDISGGATVTDVVDAQFDSVYATGAYHVPTVSAPSGNITIELPMTFVSTTAAVSASNTVGQGTANAEVAKILVVTSSTGAPIDVSSMDITTSGTTSLSDIANLKVFYSGNNGTSYVGANQFGTTIASPAATQTITGVQSLTNDSNYFWITYDVLAGATLGDTIDGGCTSITIDASAHTPTTTNATGYRRIRQPYCIPTITYASNSCSYGYTIAGVTTTGGITNISNAANGCVMNSPTSYVDYTSKVVTVSKNTAFTINVSGATSNSMNMTVWIDYNQDGDFDDAGERVAGNTGVASAILALSASITVPCDALSGKTIMRVRAAYYNYLPNNACSNAASGGNQVYYGESEDYTIDILDNPTHYVSSTAVQQTGSVSASTTNRKILRVPLVASGCGVGTATQFRFNTNGTTSAGDITAAKLYSTGNSTFFSTSKLLASVASPSGQFIFNVTDTLLSNIGDTNNYWLAYDMSASAGTGNTIDAQLDSVQATGIYHVPTVSAPSGGILVEVPMTYVSSTAVPSATNSVAQGAVDAEAGKILVVTSSTGAPIDVTSIDVATTGTTSLSDIVNLKVWYTGSNSTFTGANQFGATVASPAASQTVTGLQPLNNDSNYFWITYEVVSGATLGDTIDGGCTSITVDASAHATTTTNATGFRKIRQPYCIPAITYPTNSCSNNYYITSVSTTGGSTNISNLSNGCGPAATMYTDYSNQSGKIVTVKKATSFNITINCGIYYYDNATVWIDYNQDGDFADAGERVAGNTTYCTSWPTLSASITVPCDALLGKTTLRVRSSYNTYIPDNACTNAASGGGQVYYGESEDYTIDIQDNPTVYASSDAVQQTGSVSSGTSDRAVLQVPVVATGCGVGTATEFRFTSTGTTASDVTNAKLYSTGTTPYFNTSKLLATVASPSGQFIFTVADTLMGGTGTTNYYWLAYDISATASTGNVVDATIDSIQATGAYHVPTTTNPAGDISVELPMTYISSSALPVFTTKVAQGAANSIVGAIQVITSSTGAPINLNSIDVATTGTTSLSDISNLKIWSTGNSNVFASTILFGTAVASPSATQTITGNLPLANDTNYFWVTYDIAGGATLNDTVDAQITSITVDAVAQTPAATSPSGYRLIRQEYCLSPEYMYPGYVCSNGYYVTGVSTSGATTNFTNNGNGCPLQQSSNIGTAGISFSDFSSSYSCSVIKSAGFTLTIQDPSGINSYTVWIDYNQNGTFDASEMVASYNYNYTSTVNLSITTSPLAATGVTRMRVRSSAYNNPASDPCTASFAANGPYYGETEDYSIEILPMPAPTTYVWNQTSAADFTVSSNWTPTRTTVLGNDVLEFNGGGSVTVTNVPSQFVSTVTVDNATYVNLGSGSAVTLNAGDQLNLTSGGIISSSNVTVMLGTDGTNTGTLSGTGTIDGKFKRWISASTASYDFPLVSGDDSRKATINFTSAPSSAGTLTGQFIAGTPSTLGMPVTVGTITADILAPEGLWKVSSSGISGGNYTASFSADSIGGVTTYTDLVLLKRSSSFNPWTLDGTSVTTTGSNTNPVLSNTGMAGFGEYAIGADHTVNPLPVELISFTGIADSRNAYLNWMTANETNNKGFFVERSVDQKVFTAVDFVKGAGTVTSIQKYALTDVNAFEKAQSNVLYYRLKQVDMDGKFTYSNVVAVKTTKTTSAAVKVSPNPFSLTTELAVLANEEGTAEITIMDVQGKVIATKSVNCIKGASSITINELSNSYNGVYFVRFTLNGETTVSRLVKID